MSGLRYFIVLCLSVSVPTVALASVINAGHCLRGQSAPAPVAAYTQHAMHQAKQGGHAQHMVHAGQADVGDKSHCNCGCNCSGMHCATGCSAIMAANGLQDLLHYSGEYKRTAAGRNHPVAAHSLSLLRPPSPI